LNTCSGDPEHCYRNFSICSEYGCDQAAELPVQATSVSSALAHGARKNFNNPSGCIANVEKLYLDQTVGLMDKPLWNHLTLQACAGGKQ
jgi:hypothetical protein